jgi:hypothetical protein
VSRPSKLAVAALLLVSSACVAWPLYIQRVWFGSGPPSVTSWAGAPWRFAWLDQIIVVPGFWTFAALTLSATAWVWIDRRRVALVTLLLALAGYASLGIGGTRILPAGVTPWPAWWLQTESYPAPAFYVAVTAIALALAVVVWNPKGYSKERA